MTTHELMTHDPATVTPGDSIARAAQLMRQFDVGMLPVIDDIHHRRLAGVITDRDIVIRCLAEAHLTDCRIGDHMSKETLTTVTPSTPVEEVAARMERFQVRRLPVVDTLTKRVVGVITLGDLARRVGPTNPELVEQLTERIYTPGSLVA